MIPLRKLANDKAKAIELLKNRGFTDTHIVEKVLEQDEARRNTQQTLDQKQAELNKLSKEIGELYKKGETAKAEEAKAQTNQLKTATQELSQQLRDHEEAIRANLVHIPNIPHPDVPPGEDEEANVQLRTGKKEAKPMEAGKPHWELTKAYNLVDFDAGNKITGAGFPVYTGRGARIQRAMLNYFLDQATQAGYKEHEPPLLVNEDTAFGTGQLPDKEGQMYHLEQENLYLIPTAEVPLTNLYRDEMLKAQELPVQLTAYTPCFRREAGSYGQHVRGLNRLHQFDKVEIVEIEHPERSYETLERMVSHVEKLIESLGLSYRVMKLCGGDLGFAAAFTYDIEVYAPAQQRWLEASSISNFEDYQANRLNLRFKDENNKKQLAHTLNGSALAFPRLLAALLEQHQQDDHIQLPEPLADYCGFQKIQ